MPDDRDPSGIEDERALSLVRRLLNEALSMALWEAWAEIQRLWNEINRLFVDQAELGGGDEREILVGRERRKH